MIELAATQIPVLIMPSENILDSDVQVHKYWLQVAKLSAKNVNIC